MKASICMSTRNKADHLSRTLASILVQSPGFDYEIIVADDGSTDVTPRVCSQFAEQIVDHRRQTGKRIAFKYIYIKNDRYRNPSVARNVAYREAKGEIIIAQSDDVTHKSPEVVFRLVQELQRGEFIIARVLNWNMATNSPAMKPLHVFSGTDNPRPFFFLGSLWRSDLYAIGGNDEEFVEPCFDDNWFADCLIHGLQLQPRFVDDIVGHHQHHGRPSNLRSMARISSKLYKMKCRRAQAGEIAYCASGGPWEMT